MFSVAQGLFAHVGVGQTWRHTAYASLVIMTTGLNVHPKHI